MGETVSGFGRSRVFSNDTDRASTVELSKVRIGLETTELRVGESAPRRARGDGHVQRRHARSVHYFLRNVFHQLSLESLSRGSIQIDDSEKEWSECTGQPRLARARSLRAARLLDAHRRLKVVETAAPLKKSLPALSRESSGTLRSASGSLFPFTTGRAGCRRWPRSRRRSRQRLRDFLSLFSPLKKKDIYLAGAHG